MIMAFPTTGSLENLTTNFINDRDIDNSKLYRPNSKIYLMNEVAYFKVNKVGVFYISNYYGI